jgi:hypothetical protein
MISRRSDFICGSAAADRFDCHDGFQGLLPLWVVRAQPNDCSCGLTTFGAQSGQLLEFLDHTKEIGTEDDEDDNLTVITPYKTDIEYLSDQVLTALPPFLASPAVASTRAGRVDSCPVIHSDHFRCVSAQIKWIATKLKVRCDRTRTFFFD